MSQESAVDPKYQAAVRQEYCDELGDESDSYDDDFDDNSEEEVEVPSKDIRLWRQLSFPAPKSTIILPC